MLLGHYPTIENFRLTPKDEVSFEKMFLSKKEHC